MSSLLAQTVTTLRLSRGRSQTLARDSARGHEAVDWLWRSLLVIAICRLAFVAYSGLEFNRGDFYATLPGAYAESLNPELWRSPDLQDASGYDRPAYLYGPSQYLAILPLIFFDSYQAIATFLLVFYAILIALSAEVMWRSARLLGAPPTHGRVAVFASTFMFFPVLVAFVQREFEVVILFVATCALHALLLGRQVVGGALVAYITWFKFFPLAFLPYFALRSWKRSVIAYALVSIALLGITHAWLDLRRFGTVVELAGAETIAVVSPDEFCGTWSRPETRRYGVANETRVNVQWALCRFEAQWPWLNAQWLHAGLLTLILAVFATGYRRLQRHGALDPACERRRVAVEVGLVLIVPWMFLHAHYYYLSVAIIPLNVLLVRYLSERHVGGWNSLAIWACTYCLLGAFVVPPTILSNTLEVDFWHRYMQSGIYLFGELLLLGLLLWEYVKLWPSASSVGTVTAAHVPHVTAMAKRA